jgi:hypothetical protein
MKLDKALSHEEEDQVKLLVLEISLLRHKSTISARRYCSHEDVESVAGERGLDVIKSSSPPLAMHEVSILEGKEE